jgi:hypothetical protein
VIAPFLLIWIVIRKLVATTYSDVGGEAPKNDLELSLWGGCLLVSGTGHYGSSIGAYLAFTR